MGKYEALTLDFQAKKADEEAQLEKIMEGLQEATAELRAQLEVAQVCIPISSFLNICLAYVLLEHTISRAYNVYIYTLLKS